MLTLAGCSSDSDDGTDDNNSPTPTGSPGTNTETNKKTKTNKTKNLGTVVEDFETDVGKWQVDYGRFETRKDSYQGSQSIVLTPQKPKDRAKRFKNIPYARITKYFGGDNSKPLDLSTNDLSMAVKVNKPADAKITVKLFTGGLSLLSKRYIPIEMDGWVRYDLGYTAADKDLPMDQILGMQIIIDSRGFTNSTKKEFEIGIDDIRTIPKPKKGKVIFQFDDGVKSAHSTSFPILKEKGFPAATAVIPDAIGNETRMSREELVELSNAGWDIMSHPQTNHPLPKLSKEVQEQKIRTAKQALMAFEFEKGARHFVAPNSRVSKTTLDIVKKYHETCFLFGGCPNNAQQSSNPYFISRVQGNESPRGTMDVIDMADRFNQLAVISYHRVGDGVNKVPTSTFQAIVDYVASKDVDVITPSQLIDG